MRTSTRSTNKPYECSITGFHYSDQPLEYLQFILVEDAEFHQEVGSVNGFSNPICDRRASEIPGNRCRYTDASISVNRSTSHAFPNPNR
ncbi:hypothetical protein NPIL_556511 [Nephila pilipes]|uniref:Uncharacterized protein n=1 Tax=Nephila pilipes TaxID=299642 RepID=A0A8X6JZH4_NEPPI|nr:hypothetical protein NPIL_556511 [Nephila pilipes]